MRLIPRTSVGIEIAGQDVRIAVLREFGGHRRVLRLDVLAGFIGLPQADQTSELSLHFQQHKLSHYNAHLSLPGACGVTRDLEFPAAVGLGENLRSAVALQVENLSPWGVDEIYWDCAWEPAAKQGRPTVVHVAIVPRAVLDPWIELFRSAAVALTGASLSSLSWAHGVNVLWGSDRPTMVLAAETTYVEGALIHDDHIHATVMDGDAANLAGSSASQLLRAGRVDSIDQVRFVGHGTSSEVTGVQSDPLPLQGAASGTTAFGAVCAALLGLARSGFRSNLIPAALRRQRNYAQWIPTYALVGLLVLLGVFALIREPYQQSLYAERLDQEAQRLAVDVRPVANQEAQLNLASDRLKALSAVERSRDSNLEALRELSRMLPQGTWLSSYSAQDNVATIAGLSDSAATIQKLLEDSALFRDAQFASSITRDPSGKDRFVIRATIEAAQ